MKMTRMDSENGDGELQQLWDPDGEMGENSESKSKSLGVPLGFAAGVLFGVANVSAKLVGSCGVTAVRATFVQNVFAAVVFVPLVAYFKHPIFAGYSKRERGLLALNSLAETAGRIALYYALNLGLAGNVSSITFGAQPLFTPLMARLCCGVRCRITDAIGSVFNIVGIVLIAGPAFLFKNVEAGRDKNPVLAIVLSLGAAFSFSASAVLIHSMPDVHIFVILLYASVVGAVINFPLLFTEAVPWDLNGVCWAYIVMLMLCNFLGLLCVTSALHKENSATIVLLLNIQIVVGYIADVVIFGKTVAAWEAVGGGLVLASSAIIACYSCWENRSKKLPTAAECTN